MSAFGDRLRREREMRGITLDEIAESTKISRRHLESLENEDFDSLPGGIFNKGFVRAYARFLGIDEDQAVADYSANANEAPPPEDQFPLEIHEEPVRKRTPQRSNVGLIGGIAATVVLVAGYAFWARKGHSQENASSVSAAGPATTVTNSPAPATEPVPVAATQPPPAATVQQSVPVQQSAPPTQAPLMVAATVAPALRDIPQAPAPAVRPKPQPLEHTFFIIIKAKEDAWISVVADGRRVAHGTLRAEKQRFIRAGKQIIVTTGNAGGLEVSYNGKPLGVIGNESEARVLMFTPAGMAN